PALFFQLCHRFFTNCHTVEKFLAVSLFFFSIPIKSLSRVIKILTGKSMHSSGPIVINVSHMVCRQHQILFWQKFLEFFIFLYTETGSQSSAAVEISCHLIGI